MEPSTYRGLTFLLSLGALPIACNPEKGGTTDGGSGGTTADDGTSSDGGVTTSGSTGAGSTDTGSTGSTDTGGTSGACAAYVAFKVMCDPSLAGMEAQLLADCETERKKTAIIYGEACVAPLDAANECVAMSGCGAQDPCTAEWMAVENCLPEPGPVCQAYAAKVVECMPGTNLEFEAGSCQADLNDVQYYSGPGCGAAYEEYYACIAELSCSELAMDVFCDPQVKKLEAECV